MERASSLSQLTKWDQIKELDGISLFCLTYPSEPEPGLPGWCQWHTKESSDEPSSGLNEEAVLEIVMEDWIEITTAANRELPMLLHC